jgi:hypothetical protein
MNFGGIMTLIDDFRYALRVLRKSPAYTATAIAALALGIGANTAIFSVFNALLLGSLPYGDPQTLVAVWEDASKMGYPRNTPAPGNFSDWKTEIPAFQDVAAADTYDAILTGDGEPEKTGAAKVTVNLFSVCGVRAFAGRLFHPEEDVPDARVVLLSYGFWLRHFAGDSRRLPAAAGVSARLRVEVAGPGSPHHPVVSFRCAKAL